MSSARPVAQVYEGAADAAAAGTAGQQAATTATTAAVPTATQSPMLGLGVTQTGESSTALGQVIGGKFVPNDTSGGGGLMGSALNFAKENPAVTMGAAQMAMGGISGMAQAGATDRKTEAEQGLVDAKTGESKAMTTLAEKKAAGPSVPGVTMNTNPNAKIYGKNADGSIRTQEQYVAAWRNAYRMA